MKFLDKIAAAYKVESEDGPSHTGIEPGSAHPANWVTQLQTGKSTEEIRQEAVNLHNILTGWQDLALQAGDIFKTLEANGGKYFEMFNPILLKGMSRSKLSTIAVICARLAKSASIQ